MTKLCYWIFIDTQVPTLIRKQICVKIIKFKVVIRKALFFLLNTGIISWAKVPESQKNMHGKANSEYMTLISTFVELVT